MPTVNIAATTRPSVRQLGALFCCLSLVMVDGFDVQAIGFVGPSLVRTWHLQPAALGPIFSAGLCGALIGSAFGGAGDRYGLLPVLTFSTLLFASGTVGTAWTTNTSELIVLRFLTGIGLGGTLPNVLALAASQTPVRMRATLVAIVLIGMPLGAGLGGVASVALIASSGWEMVFVLGTRAFASATTSLVVSAARSV